MVDSISAQFEQDPSYFEQIGRLVVSSQLEEVWFDGRDVNLNRGKKGANSLNDRQISILAYIMKASPGFVSYKKIGAMHGVAERTAKEDIGKIQKTLEELHGRLSEIIETKDDTVRVDPESPVIGAPLALIQQTKTSDPFHPQFRMR